MLGVGVDTALTIWYAALISEDMFPTATFLDARIAVAKAAKEIYNVTSLEYLRADFSWGLCGVGELFIPEPPELLVNGKFETTGLPWEFAGSTVAFYVKKGKHYVSAVGHALLGVGHSDSGTVSQVVGPIDSNAVSAELTYWVYVNTSETTQEGVHDRFFVEIKDTSNGMLIEELDYLSNLNQTSGYIQRGPFSLLPYTGYASITLQFRVITNPSYSTQFYVDDASIKVTLPV